MGSERSLKRVESETQISEDLLDTNLIEYIRSAVRSESSAQDFLLNAAAGVCAITGSGRGENDEDVDIGLDIDDQCAKGEMDVSGLR
jgi:hypothetical protein